jgi:squalene-hopene/tetraprenyl-beta-curcumene cyclase
MLTSAFLLNASSAPGSHGLEATVKRISLYGLCVGLGVLASAAEAPVGKVGLTAEVRVAVDPSLQKGTAYLLSRQEADGSWLHHPAVTALAATALLQAPSSAGPAVSGAAAKAIDFVKGFAKPDGSIWAPGEGQYPNYSTAISLIALVAADRPADREIMRKARQFLLGPTSQCVQVPESDPAFGGIGYGKSGRPDLSNTQWALEALYVSRHLDREPYTDDPAQPQQAELAWGRALTFLTRCQNLAETNKSGWVTSDPENVGGFIYFPGSEEEGLPPESKAGEADVNGVKALRSYGSMTYAGLKSMVYARVRRDDPRVKAAMDWVRRHYTFKENPGIGAQGHYYYLNTCAKALSAYGDEVLTDANGVSHPWRDDLCREIVSRQKAEGFWVNEASGRWMESIPELSTCYAMLALQAVAGYNPVP